MFIPYFNISGLDWWINKTVNWHGWGEYGKYAYDREAKRVLDNYIVSKEHPLFMYYAHQEAHVPLQAPAEFFEHCMHITNDARRVYCAMLAAMDDSLARLIAQLKEKQMWDDTLLIVFSDNGGMVPAAAFPPSIGSNMPLRAGKGTAFEGGIRVVNLVAGGANVLPKAVRGTHVPHALTHVVDWLPTILNMTNAAHLAPSNLDGVDLWDVLVNDQKGRAHDSLPLNLNNDIGFPNSGFQRAVVDADGWKLIEEHVTGPVLHYDG